MKALIIPRYYYLGSVEDTMRDPKTMILSSSFKEAYMHTPLDWIRDNSVLLMYGHDYDLLVAKDVYEELTRWEQWYSGEQQRIEKEYPEIDPIKERRYSGTLMAARQLAWKRVQEQAAIYLDEIAFKALRAAVC
jgi:hypothetical protein